MNEGCQTPILLLIFNRPETTRVVLESIRKARPGRLFVAADGPRTDRYMDVEMCQAARDVIAEVDWPCRVQTLFRDSNLGCGVGVSTGITWFFENVERGIVLEDDCVPSQSFYSFCEELLARFEENRRIMHVAGSNFQYGKKRGRASYYFSRYVNVWGWASWRRAWHLYDFSLRPSWRLQDTWDTQWQLSVERAEGLAVVSQPNLVTNIGFGPEATHTQTGARFAGISASEVVFPLRHPGRIAANQAADHLTYYANHRNIPDLRLMWFFQITDFSRLLFRRVKKLIPWLGSQGPLDEPREERPRDP